MPEQLKIDITDEALLRSRSKTRRLADLLPEIEKLLAKGISRQSILTDLNEQGFALTMDSFATMLKRLRKRVASKTPHVGETPRSPVRPAIAAAAHARLVHQQFNKGSDGRPPTVQHNLTAIPEW